MHAKNIYKTDNFGEFIYDMFVPTFEWYTITLKSTYFKLEKNFTGKEKTFEKYYTYYEPIQ